MLQQRKRSEFLITCKSDFVILRLLLPKYGRASRETYQTYDFIADYDDLFSLDELCAFCILINASVIEARSTTILRPAGDQIVTDHSIAKAELEPPIMTLYNWDLPFGGC